MLCIQNSSASAVLHTHEYAKLDIQDHPLLSLIIGSQRNRRNSLMRFETPDYMPTWPRNRSRSSPLQPWEAIP